MSEHLIFGNSNAKSQRAFMHEPWAMTPIDQIFNDFELGKNHPKPIVNLQKSRKFASDTLWQMQKDDMVKKEASRILKKQTLSTYNN